MRHVGTISNENDAKRFADYLFTLGVVAKIEPEQDAWAVWVRDEEQVARASDELAVFLNDPASPKFAAAQKEARSRRDQLARREDEARRNLIDMRRRWDGRPTGPIPVTLALIAFCVVVSVLTNLGGSLSDRDDGPAFGLMDKLLLVPTRGPNDLMVQIDASEVREMVENSGASGAVNQRIRWGALAAVRSGQVWRLVTPIFLHFSPLHLLFNMSMFYSLGGLIESRRGTWRFALLVLASAILSNIGQFYFPSLNHPEHAYDPFGGMSGVVYALFGYIWMKSRYEPTAELYMHPNTVVLMIGWLVICMFGVIGNIANWAHGIGLAVGVLIGIAPYAWRQTMRYLSRSIKGRSGNNQRE